MNDNKILNEIKDLKWTNEFKALFFACVFVRDNKVNAFTTSDITSIYNKYSDEFEDNRVRCLSRELASNVSNNSSNLSSKQGKDFYKIINKGSGHLYSLTPKGLSFANEKIENDFSLQNKDYFAEEIIARSNKVVITETKEISISEIYEKFRDGEFVIPRYQRGYVWNDIQAQSLQYSLSKNYPIGSFLTWESGNINYIIDGQQRTQTILRIYSKPANFINDIIFGNYIDKDSEFSYTKISNLIDELRCLSIEEIKSHTFQGDSVLSGSELERLKLIIVEYCENLTVNNENTYPSITIKNADENNIIEIFEFLNTKGTPLTKFEILSSKWAKHTIKLKDINWINSVSSMYGDNVVIDEGGTHIETREKIYTPSEIFYVTLRKSITEGYSGIFKKIFKDKKVKNTYEIDSKLLMPLLWIFRIWYVSKNNLDLSKTKFDSDFDINLGEYIANVASNNFGEIEKLIEVLNKVWVDVQKRLPILKKIDTSDSIVNKLSKNLFISTIAQVLYKRLENPNYKINNELQYYFIAAILNNDFASSTNSRLEKDIKYLKYLSGKITTDDIRHNISNLNEKHRMKSEFDDGFQSTVKFVIAIAYDEYTGSKPIEYDYDHIFPKKAMEKLEVLNGIHTIGNCGQLQLEMNRAKQDKIIVDELLMDELIKNKWDEETLSEYKKSINFISNIENSKKDRQDEFDKVTSKRYEFLIDSFINRISI